MKRRIICAQEANEVEIQFRDKSYVATFNMKSVRYLQEELDHAKGETISYEHFAAMALYSGIKVNHPDIAREEANALILTMRPADVNDIVDEYTKSVNGVSVKENQEELKKVIAQILGKTGGI